MNNITFRNIVAFLLATIISTAGFLGLLRINDYEQSQHEQYVQAVANAADGEGSKYEKQ